ncbi:unnamed protein product [Alternaria sp. RS040]
MAVLRTLLVSCAVLWAIAAAAILDSAIQVRNAPGHTVEDTWRAIRRGLAVASLEEREPYTADLPLARSWDGATLLSVEVEESYSDENQTTNLELKAGITVTCKTCYVKGNAKAELTIGDNLNASELIGGVVDDVKNETIEFADKFVDYLYNYTDSVCDNLKDGLDAKDFTFPTFPFAFDIDVPEIEDANLRFQFDGMELYLEIDTVLTGGAAYEINLYTSNTPVGISVGPSLTLGVTLQVDLILEVDGQIDISSGFHVKLDDGVAMDITMFGDTVSNMIFNGGQFEFLPVTLVSASVSIAAVLRVGVHCGVEVGQPELPGIADLFADSVGFEVNAGVELALFANVAEFVTNISYVPEDDECKLKVVQEYNFALGALAGASIVVDLPVLSDNMTYGPVASATTAIFTTTLAEACAVGVTSKPPQVIPTGAEKRQDLVTHTTSTVTTGVGCKNTATAMCPNSEQISTRATITRTLVVSSGESAVWPETMLEKVKATKEFGPQVRSMKTITGSPVPYVAPPGEENHGLDGTTGGVSNKVIIGICVGLVLPLLAAIIGAIIFFRRRKRYNAVGGPAAPMLAEPYMGHNDYTDQIHDSKSPNGNVTEIQR